MSAAETSTNTETSTNAVPVPRTSVPGLTVTGDNDFFFEAAKEGRLEIQRCADCKTLRHPPAPACPSCRSFSWDTVESTRRCTLHSFTVIHHPKDPAFSTRWPSGWSIWKKVPVWLRISPESTTTTWHSVWNSKSVSPSTLMVRSCRSFVAAGRRRHDLPQVEVGSNLPRSNCRWTGHSLSQRQSRRRISRTCTTIRARPRNVAPRTFS